MDIKIVHDLRNWFISYLKTFKYENPELQRNIDIKRELTERVKDQGGIAGSIAKFSVVVVTLKFNNHAPKIFNFDTVFMRSVNFCKCPE